MSFFPDEVGPGAFVPMTQVWDITRLQEVEVTSPEFKELLIRLYRNINDIALTLNIKDTGYYVREEFVNGQAFFENPALSSTTSQTPQLRQVFRKLINFGSLPNSTSKSVAHNIAPTTDFTFTRIYGTASDTTSRAYLPLPYAATTAANNIELQVTSTNVVITTGSNRSNFGTTYVVLEYIKQ